MTAAPQSSTGECNFVPGGPWVSSQRGASHLASISEARGPLVHLQVQISRADLSGDPPPPPRTNPACTLEDLLRTGSENYELRDSVFYTVSDSVSDKLTYPTGYFEQLENYSLTDEIAQNFDICISHIRGGTKS